MYCLRTELLRVLRVFRKCFSCIHPTTSLAALNIWPASVKKQNASSQSGSAETLFPSFGEEYFNYKASEILSRWKKEHKGGRQFTLQKIMEDA